MSLIIATTSFATADASFEQGEFYDTALREVEEAVREAPENFRGYPSTCVCSFACADPANPDTARIIRKGDQLRADDWALIRHFGNGHFA